jgi:hypothetical protein
MFKTFIVAFLLLITHEIDCYSQTLSDLIPIDLNSSDKSELIKYMTDEIVEKYYWKENLVKFYTLKHPVGYVNFAAKSDKGDIYYFVWETGIVPQLVAAENSVRIAEGKKLAQKRDLEISEAVKKKVQDRIDSLYATYQMYIDSSVVLAPPEFKDSLRTLIYNELNQEYRFCSVTGDYDSFKEETDSHIKGSVEGSIKYYERTKVEKLRYEEVQKINQVNSLIYDINERISYGRLSGQRKKELIDILKKDFTDVCPNELNIFVNATSAGSFMEYEIRSVTVVNISNWSSAAEVEIAYNKALNFEKIYLAVEKFLKK